MPMASRGSASVKDAQVVLAGHTSKTEPIETPLPGDRARARQARGLGKREALRAAPPVPHLLGGRRGWTRSRKVGGSSRRRWNGVDHGGPEGESGRGGTRCATHSRGPADAQQTRPSAPAHRLRPARAGRARRTPSSRGAPSSLSPPTAREVDRGWRCFDSPLVHVGFVVRRSLDLGITPGASFAGESGSGGDLSTVATRDGGGSRRRRGVDHAKRRRIVPHRRGRSLPPGERLEVEDQARGVSPCVL